MLLCRACGGPDGRIGLKPTRLRDNRRGPVAKRLSQPYRRKGEEDLSKLLKGAAGTPLSEFTASLKGDLAVLQAALDTPWTTSPAEGRINRIETIKRPMYGRAGFPLLRARVLNAV